METRLQLLIPEAILRIADSANQKLAWQFFLVFSRFEYALKRQKYIQVKRKDAQAAWKSFSKKHATMFIENQSPELLKAITYLKEYPPMKQIHENCELSWDKPEQYDGGSLLPWLIDQVLTVRNNLFHGGKFPQFPVPDPSRDPALIESALVILSHALRLDPGVESRFNEDMEL